MQEGGGYLTSPALAETSQWSRVAPLAWPIPRGVTQPLQLALVHCLGVARGCCEAEMSPALPGTPQRMLTPKGEGKLF